MRQVELAYCMEDGEVECRSGDEADGAGVGEGEPQHEEAPGQREGCGGEATEERARESEVNGRAEFLLQQTQLHSGGGHVDDRIGPRGSGESEERDQPDFARD